MISSGVPKRHEWLYNASVAATAVTSFVGKSSTYQVNVLIMTRMNVTYVIVGRHKRQIRNVRWFDGMKSSMGPQRGDYVGATGIKFKLESSNVSASFPVSTLCP